MIKIVLVATAVFCTLYREVKLECSPNSMPQEIQSCPRSEKETKEAAKKLKCEEKCGKMEYHCLPYTSMDAYVELCAQQEFIIGKRCAEYNKVGGVVQANRYNPLADCSKHPNPCPAVYYSADLYKYHQCFNQSSKNNSFVETVYLNNTSMNSTESGSESSNDVMITVISISVSVFCIGVILIVIWKTCFCRRGHPQTEKMDAAQEEILMSRIPTLIIES